MPKNKWMYGLAATLISFLLFEIANFSSYSVYNTSMDKVQTVEFNMLSHMLPTKLSYLLINRDFDEIEKTLKSNYGVFGFVLTDCTLAEGKCVNERVIFANGKKSNSFIENQSWKETFDLLRSPAPLEAEQSIPDYHFHVYKKLSHHNVGDVIGRVYYIPSSPTPFVESQIYWVKKVAFTGRNDRYSYANNLKILGLSLLLFTFFFFSRKRQAKLGEEKRSEESKRLQAENELLRAKNEELKAKEDLLTIENFNKILSNQIDQEYSSVVANELQHLDSIREDILSRIKFEVLDITHDLSKAPLLLINQSPAMLHQVNDQDQLNELMQELNDSIKTISLATHDLKEMTSLAPIKTNLRTLAHNFIDDLPPVLRGKNAPSIELAIHDDIFIFANPYHIKSIIKNALYNSTAALKKKNRIKKDENFHAKVQINIFADYQYAFIEITDNGDGIPEEYIHKLYESTEKVNVSQGGSGKGSLIVTAYLSFHHGHVTKKNLPTGGACITFSFPLFNETNA